jgi:hypothetical protein
VTTGTSWLNGAFSKLARAGQFAGTKTREKFQVAVSNLTSKVSDCAPTLLLFSCIKVNTISCTYIISWQHFSSSFGLGLVKFVRFATVSQVF